jgi:hypothetical protein
MNVTETTETTKRDDLAGRLKALVIWLDWHIHGKWAFRSFVREQASRKDLWRLYHNCGLVYSKRPYIRDYMDRTILRRIEELW